MTANQDFASSKKRVRIFLYEFDGYFNGDTTILGSDGVLIKEEGGFFLIVASVLLVLSVILLGLDLALSPLLSLQHLAAPAESQLPAKKDLPAPERNATRERFPCNDGQSTSRAYSERRGSYAAAFGPVTCSNRRHHNSPASRETSFTTTSQLRPREYWL